MRVAIANLTNGGMSGGYQKYLTELLPLLAEHPGVEHLTISVPLGTQLPKSAAQVLPMAEKAHRQGFSDLVQAILAGDPDVVFVPSARWRSFQSVPVVCMIRNMEPLQVPFGGNGPVECLKNIGRARAARIAAHNATRVIAVSRAVRDHILTAWNLDPKRVGVVYHGVAIPPSPALLPESNRLAELAGRGFLFTAGSIRPARGLEDAIWAMKVLKERCVPHCLAIGGGVDWSSRYGRQLRRLVRRLGLEREILWLGQLDVIEMGWCFRNSDAFLMTSRAEACPNTLLEAMSYGCICVATDIPVMREFLGAQALLYQPGDYSRLASHVEQLISSRDSHLSSADENKRRCQGFTWEETASATVRELKAAAEGPS